MYQHYRRGGLEGKTPARVKTITVGNSIITRPRETGNTSRRSIVLRKLFRALRIEREDVPKRDVWETCKPITHAHVHQCVGHTHTDAIVDVLREPTRGTVDHTQALARVTATRSANPSVKLPLPAPLPPVRRRLLPLLPLLPLLRRSPEVFVLGNPPVGRRVRVVDCCRL